MMSPRKACSSPSRALAGLDEVADAIATAAIERPTARANREICLLIACVPKPICYTPNPCRPKGVAFTNRAMRGPVVSVVLFQRGRRAQASVGYEWT